KANIFDISKIHDLVNRSYRGETSKQGWTTEADLLDGQRTDPEMLREMIATPHSAIWLFFQNSILQGSVHLEVKPSMLDENQMCLYLGMLTVDPDLQNQGLGKKILLWAESQAKNLNLKSVEMTVITHRRELILWYNKYGYRETDCYVPFPKEVRFGIQKTDLVLVVLKKTFE
ncbi:MAG: GNAT family N-acetyltransferase, partial [Pseudobdellovibrionaceae bacterium]